jgi:uncharacterized protein YyaL (SSP411 family)
MANRLAREKSPYLLQHAENPVDWYPWGDDAFARARAEDKPIFLSVGYATCHWCHVMEHESFENDEIAARLNADFVSIKVDREERPDVDRVYMTFVQLTTGAGGWPMSVWLTPDLEPFYGGTYFPPTSRWQRPGFVEVLAEIARVWRDDRPRIRHSASGLAERLREVASTPPGAEVPGIEVLARTVDQFRRDYDTRSGGFGGGPKFPRPSELLFLLREHARTGAPEPRDMVIHTLRAMALGGMRDHVGGGFHRYSVDGQWRVPHFEKMLYDQAQLVLAYLEAAQVTGDPFFGEVAADTLAYVEREMTDREGGFHSAEDADSIPPEHADEPRAARMEGAFYLWTAQEIDELLGADAPVYALRHGIAPGGNAPFDPQGEFIGKNLLYVARSIDDVAAETGRTADDVEAALEAARMRLFGARLRRPRPRLDDKVLTAWNGLMIAAFARAARVLRVQALGGGPSIARRTLGGARRAASFIRERLWDPDRRVLHRRYRDGEVAIDGYAEDYAALIFGLLELVQADGDPAWLAWARDLQDTQDARFWDEAGGGWFSTTGADPSVLMRLKEDYDGAEPAASSLGACNLLAFGHLDANAETEARIRRTIQGFGTRLASQGRSVPMMASALSAWHAGIAQVVVTGADVAEGGDGAGRLFDALATQYLPFALVVPLAPERAADMGRLLPFTTALAASGTTAVAYVCHDFTCERPVTTPEALQDVLHAASPARPGGGVA